MREDMDAEMTEMEVETDITEQQQQQQQTEKSQDDVVREMLTLARHLVHQGNPSQALQAVIVAMKTKGGEAAVLQSLDRARDLYTRKRHENTDVDQLASLFAECAIAEALPTGTERSLPNISGLSVLPDARGTILAESGRTQIVLDAFSDGSSFVCLKCGGLVSKHRKDEHDAYWCGGI